MADICYEDETSACESKPPWSSQKWRIGVQRFRMSPEELNPTVAGEEDKSEGIYNKRNKQCCFIFMFVSDEDYFSDNKSVTGMVAFSVLAFQKHIRWIVVDNSSIWPAIRSWTKFVVFTFVVPAISHFLLTCDDCDSHHSRPYDLVVQLSLTSVATVSFIFLTNFLRNYGLSQFLFFDKRFEASDTVRSRYKIQIDNAVRTVSYFVTPSILAMSGYKIWWYASGGSQIPFLGNVVLSHVVACSMELCSWLYRTTIIFLVCILFRLICNLQIIRLHDFDRLLRMNTNAGVILSEHRRITHHLRIISFRYRFFILCLLVLVTGSQFYSLLITTKAKAGVSIDTLRAVELAICSLTLVSALLIILRSASIITHKVQDLTCVAAKWHAWATVWDYPEYDHKETGDEEEDVDYEETDDLEHGNIEKKGVKHLITLTELDHAEFGDEDYYREYNMIVGAYASRTMSLPKRQALVSYFENNIAGITIYGFTLDRGTLVSIFGIEFSLTLWLLGKTTGIS